MVRTARTPQHTACSGDLSIIRDGPERGAAYDAINAEALRAFVWSMPEASELVVLDWQHPCYRFNPAAQALISGAEWKVPVYPNGDYYAFLREDFSEEPSVIRGSRHYV